MVTVSPATGADWIASSAAFLIASEVRVAPETVSQLLIVSSVAAWPSSFVLNPFVLEYAFEAMSYPSLPRRDVFRIAYSCFKPSFGSYSGCV